MKKNTNYIIQTKSLSKKYKKADFFSVKELTLNIVQGEIFGLLGPNGAGKTTLISMLCGLLQSTSGDIQIKGLNFKNNRRQIQQLIGVVPQEYALYPSLTAFENLHYFGSMYGLKSTNLENKIKEGLKEMGLETFADKKIHTFSGGMKRRINLLAGILHRPEILFLDEPTVGVDVQSKNVIIAHLKKLNQENTTILYTSHHINEAQEFCSQIAIIDNGSIIVEGEPNEIVRQKANAQNLEEVFLSLTGKALRDYA